MRLIDVDGRRRRCRSMVVAMPGKLRITIASIVVGGILRALRVLRCTNRLSRSIRT